MTGIKNPYPPICQNTRTKKLEKVLRRGIDDHVSEAHINLHGRIDGRTDSATTQCLHSLAGDGIQQLCHATIPCIRSCLYYFQTIFITFFPRQIFSTSTAVI